MAVIHPSRASARSAETGFKAIPGIVREKLVGIAKDANKIGREDPRKLVHCAKVGLALTLSSLLYYFNPLYDAFGQSGIWALLTVVDVFEFTVGETLFKCLNKGLAVISATLLGIGVVYFTQLFGREGQPFIIGTLIFILAALSTFARFFNPIKKKYDNGVVVFILTFSMIAISGYREEKIMKMAYQRLLAVVIGAVTGIIISVLVFPTWTGESLSNLVSNNLEKVANALEVFGKPYFNFSIDDESVQKAIFDHEDFGEILMNSKELEDLVMHAWWEFRPWDQPWDRYIKVGNLITACIVHVQSLYTCVASGSHQAPMELAGRMKEPCTVIYSESVKALRLLSSTIKTMTHPSPAITTHLERAKAAIADLRASPLDANTDDLSSLAVAFILINLTAVVDKISEATQELSDKARFKKPPAQPDDCPSDSFSTVVEP
nr:aluminum-activated malate transporter 8-like [Ipomoea batatas]GMD88032.1 aluminum-activated malate transporter 8-like [Ipomoea batatas]